MADVEQPAKPVSPISNLLQKIGLTRDDLSRHSDQMRQFLTTQDAKSLRVFSAESADAQQSIASVLGKTRSCSHSSSNSRQNASTASQTPPPSTPVKSEPVEPAIPLRHMDSMEMILERRSRKVKRDKRGKKDKDRNAPSPSPASTAFSLDAFMQSRDLRRVPSLDQSDSSTNIASLVCTIYIARCFRCCCRLRPLLHSRITTKMNSLLLSLLTTASIIETMIP